MKLKYLFFILSFFAGVASATPADGVLERTPIGLLYQIMNINSKLVKKPCSLQYIDNKKQCSQIVKELEQSETQSGYFGLFPAPSLECREIHKANRIYKTEIKNNSEPQNGPELVEYLKKQPGIKEFGSDIHSQIESCANQDPSINKDTISRYYYLLTRAESAESAAVENLFALNYNLGENPPNTICENSNFANVREKCQILSNQCSYSDDKDKNARLDSLVKQTLKSRDIIANATIQIEKLRQSEELSKRSKETTNKINKLNDLIAYEKMRSPWLGLEIFEKSLKNDPSRIKIAIRDQLRFNKSQLENRISNTRSVTSCILQQKSSSAKECQSKSIRETFLDLPHISNPELANNPYIAESRACFEDNHEQKKAIEETNRFILDTALMAIPFGLQAKVGKQAIEGLSKMLSQFSKSQMPKLVDVMDASINSTYSAESILNTSTTCFNQVKATENSGNKEDEGSNKTCTSDGILAVSQWSPQMDTCMEESFWSALDTLPYLSSVASIGSKSSLNLKTLSSEKTNISKIDEAPLHTESQTPSETRNPSDRRKSGSHLETRADVDIHFKKIPYSQKVENFFNQITTNNEVFMISEHKAIEQGKSSGIVITHESAYLKDMNTHLNMANADRINGYARDTFLKELFSSIERSKNTQIRKLLDDPKNFLVFSDGKTTYLKLSDEVLNHHGLTELDLNELATIVQEANNHKIKDLKSTVTENLREIQIADAYTVGIGRDYISTIALAKSTKGNKTGEIANALDSKALNDLYDNAKASLSQSRNILSSNKALWDFQKNAPSIELLAALRKSDSVEVLKDLAKEKTQIQLTDPQAQHLLEIKNHLSILSPNPLTVKTEELRFNDSPNHYGWKFDFPDVGAENLQSVFQALNQDSHIKDLPKNLRAAEQRVTDWLDTKKSELNKILKTTTAGDDSLKDQALTSRRIKETIEKIATKSDLKGLRVVLAPPIANGEAKMNIANHGEEIEKIMTKLILQSEDANLIAANKEFTKCIYMNVKEEGKGSIQLLTANSANFKDSKFKTYQKEMNKQLQKYFEKAVEKFNKDNSDKVLNYHAGSR